MMTTEAYKQYRKAWERRLKEEESKLYRGKEHLMKQVNVCARRIKKLGGKRVILFGSLATGRFRKDSDIDIAVEGLSVDTYFKALSILEEELQDVRFDLIDMKEALPSVIKRIEREGIGL